MLLYMTRRGFSVTKYTQFVYVSELNTGLPRLLVKFVRLEVEQLSDSIINC